MLELALRFLIVGALAFGGGQAALPLVERLSVGREGWLSASDFSTAVGFAYATPGPVLILSAFIGYRVSGIPGAAVATVAVFAVPLAASAMAANVTSRFESSRRFRAFGRFAGAAAIGLLGVTLLSLSRPLVSMSPALLAGSLIAGWCALRATPALVLLGVGAGVGALVVLTGAG